MKQKTKIAIIATSIVASCLLALSGIFLGLYLYGKPIMDSLEPIINAYVRVIEREPYSDDIHIMTDYYSESLDRYIWVSMDEKTLDIHKVGDQITCEKSTWHYVSCYDFKCWGWTYE